MVGAACAPAGTTPTAAPLTDLDLLVYASRLIGAETSLVVWGGGNTSIKVRARPSRAASAACCASRAAAPTSSRIQRKDFPGRAHGRHPRRCSRARTWATRRWSTISARALQDPGGARPSIETLLHGFLPAPRVDPYPRRRHRLPDQQRRSAARCSRDVYGEDVIALAYRRPGFRISRDVADAFAAQPAGLRACSSRSHGTITLGRHRPRSLRGDHRADQPGRGGHRRSREGADAVRRRARCRRREPASGAGGGAGGGAATPWPAGPRAPSRCSPSTTRPDVLEFASSRDAPRRLAGGAGHAGPHDLHQARAVLRAMDRPARRRGLKAAARTRGGALRARLHARTSRRTIEGAALLDPLPRVVAGAGGLGMFTAGKDRRTAGIVSDIYRHTDRRARRGHRLGRLRVAVRPRRLRRGVLAARALQAHAGAAREGAGPPGRAGHGRRGRHRARRRPAAGRRGRPRGRRPTSTERGRGRWPRRSLRAAGAGPRHRRRHRRHRRGVGARGLRGGRARLRRARHRGVQRRHRAFGARWPRWRSPTGSVPSPSTAPGHFLVAREAMRVLMRPGARRRARLRGHQERHGAGQGLRRLLRRQGRRGAAGQGPGARGRRRTASARTS